MSERKDFFDVTVDFEDLGKHAFSSDTTLRWAAAIELGQIGTEEAISLLWSLTTDSDENVRDAAKVGLNQSDQILVGKVLANKWTVEPTVEDHGSDTLMSKHIAWKVRPLDPPTPENEWIVDAAVLNIIQTEGPITSTRLMKLYGRAVYPNTPQKLPRSRIANAVKRLEKRHLIGRADDMTKSELEMWTLYAIGRPAVVIREQGQRLLGEIPSSEVRTCISEVMGDRFEDSSQDDRFAILLSTYAIKPKDYHIIGALLENEWVGLLK